jgi:hypothetical protein
LYLLPIQVSDVNKNLKNPSADVFALRVFVLTAWLFACEQAPAKALPSSLVALQLKTSSEEKQKKYYFHACISVIIVFVFIRRTSES